MCRLSRLWPPVLKTRALCTLFCLSLTLAPVLFATPAQAFLYDTFTGGPGFPNRIDDRIEAMLPTDYVDIIVDFCHEPTAADSTFLDGFGDIYSVFRFIDAIAVQNVLVSDCYVIVNYPGLKLIEWDEPVTPNLDISSCAIQARSSATYPYPSSAAWSMNPWAGYTGNGVTVAVLDSGVDDGHPALAGKFVAGYDAFTGAGGPGVNPDDDWAGWFHGTAVAGMIMANDPAQVYMGVAPRANLVDCKVFNSAGASSASLVIGAIAWLYYGNGALYSVDVTNMSFAASVDDGTSALARAACALTSVGIVAVASGGNSPPSSGIPSPGSGDAVICVGGVRDNATILRTDDTFDSGARMGPRMSPPPLYTLNRNDLKPEVSAYMRDITTCQGVNPGQNATGWWQHPGNGTSWSTAHVSGLIAVLLEKYPGLTQVPWFQVENVLRLSAEVRGAPTYPALDPTWNNMYGWGIASAAAAVNLVLPVDVTVQPWVPGQWNSKAIWAGHYPVKVGDPNTLNARVTSIGGPASGVLVTFEAMNTGWGAPWTPIGSTTVSTGYVGTGAVATISYTPPPSMAGHRCFRVTATYSADTNHSNDTAQENIDILPAKAAVRFAADDQTGSTSTPAAMARASRDERFAFPVTMCVEETAPFPFRTADACICTKDLPPGVEAWLEPEPPFDLAPGECQPCSLIVAVPEGVVVEPGDAVHVNGWFWGNGVAEGGVTIYFYSTPPIEATIGEVQYTDDPTGPSPMEGQTVKVSGVATTENSTYPDRFAIQDGEGPWSGLFVRDIGLEVNRGDSLTVTGVVVETDGLTELDLLTGFETVSTGNPLPEPEVVPPVAVETDESYEGVLVSVEDVVVVDPTPDDWMVEGPDGTVCKVGHWGSYSYVPQLADELDVTGVSGSLESAHRLQPRDDDDIEPATGTPPDNGVRVFSMSQNAPNPFGRSTGITYALPRDSYVLLRVYNVAGRLVRTLVDGEQPAGTWSVAWDGADDEGHGVSAGVYFYRFEAGGKTIAKRMVLIQ
jgi:subtilisin family serine protease